MSRCKQTKIVWVLSLSPVDSSASNQRVLVLTPDSHPADGVSAQQIDGSDGSSLAPSVKLVTV